MLGKHKKSDTVSQKLNKQKKVRAKRQRKNAPPKTSQDSIGYLAMYEDGICEIEPGLFSKTLFFSDVNYSMADDDEQINVFSKYCDLLNVADNNTHLQLTVLNRKIDLEAFQKSVLIPAKDDMLQVYRDEMNDMLLEKVKSGQHSFFKAKYLTFSHKASDLQHAQTVLKRIEYNLMQQLKKLGTEPKALNGLERLSVMHEQLRPEKQFLFTYDDLRYSGLTTHSAIAPMSLNFKKSKSQFEFGDFIGSVLLLRDYPTDLTDGMIADLTAIPINMTITIHIDNRTKEESLDFVKSRIGFMEQQKINEQQRALRSGYDPEIVSQNLKESLEEAEILKTDLKEKNQKLTNVTFSVFVYAENQETLDDYVERVFSVGRSNSCVFERLHYLQEQGLSSSLLIGKNNVPIQRTLTTASTAVFVPFTAQEIMDANGTYYGVNATTENIITFDRTKLKAPNGFILGTPGSGKSFTSKREIINAVLKNPEAEIIVIDPEREYSILAEHFNGEIVKISAGSTNYINPFDILSDDYGNGEDPILHKTDFLLSLFELLLGGKNGLEAVQRGILDRTCRQVYQSVTDRTPTLVDFFNVLHTQSEQVSKDLSISLEPYTKGSLSLFAHETNVNTKSPFIVYDIKDLGKQLRSLGMVIVLDQIWNRITINRAKGIRTYVYIDEMQLLFSNEHVAVYFFELWSRARKWGAIPTGMTQNVETLLLSDLARRMLSNSDFIIMLNQATSDRDELVRLLHISPEQEEYITGSEEGSGLLFAGKGIIPFYDRFPKNTQLYKIMSTKIQESL
ncbi:DUF87 domain-containing protein [Granulicatella sp. zg-ZJ]|uniref:VirB4-like conjugal transfer ATPase, CD1110 family n=1 Tax=Granulicatella sp. zg-ZJ TaxID=2678504 RepID=UPI0013D4B49C|nr:DUF87 domain-containing protein [Granulicatella sp. zg-ZJ]MBS4749588.1 ATP-binding protein [Carnobacteriaceae bacterium zg-ZUI78]NEW62436.1 DUF87 domain-containing protein [Granulicatella sp. zg-ZJ]NEW62982.1 DUF87 domain-containing protein [Granulicatella sp. zg-ZJ]